MYFGVKKSGICVFLVSAENGAGVNRKTNTTYVHPQLDLCLVLWKMRRLILDWPCQGRNRIDWWEGIAVFSVHCS